MVGSDADLDQCPSSHIACIADCCFDGGPLRKVECDGGMLHECRVAGQPLWSEGNSRSTIRIRMPVNGASLVSMEPRAMGTKRDEVSEGNGRGVGVHTA